MKHNVVLGERSSPELVRPFRALLLEYASLILIRLTSQSIRQYFISHRYASTRKLTFQSLCNVILRVCPVILREST